MKILPPDCKDLPSHLEYAFLEGDDKLPVIIAKNLKDEDKTALIKVLKSHKHAIAWKISDIKGIDPQFCTHKILMEENAKPGKKLLTFSKLATVDPPGDTTVPITQLKSSSIQVNEVVVIIPLRQPRGWGSNKEHLTSKDSGCVEIISPGSEV
ncbi:hypothetical protein Tco_1243983 [Tanacetum coccineum]